MAIIPNHNHIQELMEGHLVANEHRDYMGMSSLGQECQRKIWYDFHWAYTREIEDRLSRIFKRGNWEEQQIVRDLEAKGVTITDQQRRVKDSTGHIKGHIDGIVLGLPGCKKTPHLLEIKTMKASRYNQYLRLGLQKTNPTYYIQINQYMHYLGLKDCLFVVTNKDTEDRDWRRMKYDNANFKEYTRVAMDVLTSELPPSRIGTSIWMTCKFCDAKSICHEGQDVRLSCRLCKYASIEMEGKWSCDLWNKTLTTEDQIKACTKFTIIDGVEY